MNAGPACPDETTLRRYASDALAAAEVQAVAEHVASCAACTAVLRDLTATAVTKARTPPDGGPVRADAATVAADVAVGAGLQATAAGYNDVSDELDLAFLLPAERPDSLGRIGRFDVLAPLGRGGMGIVFKAFDDSLHRTVAVKVLTPELASSPKARRRFLREARAAAAINHPNVITIHAVDEQNGMPYLVMEYVSGHSLRERIRKPLPLEPIEMARIGLQIAQGLAAAHAQGVIHRDIKPSNVMLEDGIERVKIADFGLARAAMDLNDITSLGHAVGTPAYIAPEQISGGVADERSDLFSLGCVLYAMATGNSPFHGRYPLEVIRQVADHHPPRLNELDARIPRSLADVVERLLAKSPGDRYASAKELASTLTQQLARMNQMPSDRMPTLAATRSPRRRWIIPIAACVGVLAALSVPAWLPRDGQRADDNKAPVGPATEVIEKSETHVVSVAQTGEADCRTIQDALQRARPDSTIRILDDAIYSETIKLDDAARWSGVILDAPQRATLAKPGGNDTLMTVRDTPGVQIRGLKLKLEHKQHGIFLEGACEGLRLDGLLIDQPHDSPFAAIVLTEGATGTEAKPILLENLELHCGWMGLLFHNLAPNPAAWIICRNSRFTGGDSNMIILESAMHDVTISGNLFYSGVMGISMKLDQPRQAARVTIVNNTFYNMQFWMGLAESSLDQSNISIRRNLVLRSQRLKFPAEQLSQIAGSWFRDNWWQGAEDVWWEGDKDIDRQPLEQVARFDSSLLVLSREPADPDFLRPLADSPLASAGPGNSPGWVGALEPARRGNGP
ncbi:MAG TPA: serine/threonine-protein kinase [Pirellulales bacterium]|nr:serine/threonine-protein kinase [Pirellulales bacterium]